jgi:lysophospholipase L1-like esterase
MLEIALRRLYPRAKLEVLNAGISGNTTGSGLNRIQRDVLDRKPSLVAVMFGMNDASFVAEKLGEDGVKQRRAGFQANLRRIVQMCREQQAEVVLCTPNSVYPNAAPSRPPERLADYAEAVRAVARELNAPAADCFAAYEAVRAKDPQAWMLLMSETIHPGLHGHKLFAEVVAETISGRRVSLADVRPQVPCIPHALDKLAKGGAMKVIVTEPYEESVRRVLTRLAATALDIQVTTWPTAGQTLRQMEAWAQNVRKLEPDLVVVAVPEKAVPEDREAFIRSYSWLLDLSLPFARAVWDVVVVLPSPDQATNATTDLMRAIALGHDLGYIERPPGDTSSPEELLSRWFISQRQAVK